MLEPLLVGITPKRWPTPPPRSASHRSSCLPAAALHGLPSASRTHGTNVQVYKAYMKLNKFNVLK